MKLFTHKHTHTYMDVHADAWMDQTDPILWDPLCLNTGDPKKKFHMA